MLELDLFNREILRELSKLGHTDSFVISDAGLAIPKEMKVVDLSIKKNFPTVPDVLEEILKIFSVEKVVISEDLTTHNPTKQEKIFSFIDEDLEVEIISQDAFRGQLVPKAKFVIRTGDFDSYSNIYLVSAGGKRWFSEKE